MHRRRNQIKWNNKEKENKEMCGGQEGMNTAKGIEKVTLREGKQGQYIMRVFIRLTLNIIFKPLFVISKK